MGNVDRALPALLDRVGLARRDPRAAQPDDVDARPRRSSSTRPPHTASPPRRWPADPVARCARSGTGSAADLAEAFDARNGTTYYADRLADWLDLDRVASTPHLPPVRLRGGGRRHAPAAHQHRRPRRGARRGCSGPSTPVCRVSSPPGSTTATTCWQPLPPRTRSTSHCSTGMPRPSRTSRPPSSTGPSRPPGRRDDEVDAPAGRGRATVAPRRGGRLTGGAPDRDRRGAQAVAASTCDAAAVWRTAARARRGPRRGRAVVARRRGGGPRRRRPSARGARHAGGRALRPRLTRPRRRPAPTCAAAGRGATRRSS